MSYAVLEEIKRLVVEGDYEHKIEKLTQRAIDEGCEVEKIVNDGLVAGIETIGRLWKEGEAFIPEVVCAAEIMHAGMSVVKKRFGLQAGTKPLGKVVIGTVKGDVHDVGKSLVSMMLEASGFSVHDIGIDVTSEKFVEVAKNQEADVVGMSALLTTTMPQMERTIKAIKEAGLKVKTMVGGAPVTQEYADEIGADGYAPDAISAVDKARELLR